LALAKHAEVSADDLQKAKAIVLDGHPDTSAEMVALGNAAGAAWTLVTHVQATNEGPTSYRLELTACQTSSGRVESVARNVSGDNRDAQIAEMLEHLLRAEGLGNFDLQWKIVPTRAATAGTAKPQSPPPPDTRASYTYGEGAPLLLSAGLWGGAAAARPDNARGSSAGLSAEVALGYALSKVPGLELRLGAGVAFVGPTALHADGGARFLFAPLRGTRFFTGAEVTLGVFAPFGGDKTARFLARPALVVALGLTERVQLDALPELWVAPGGTGTLILLGGSLRGSIRFP
jgi:hypothetical protein